MLKDIGFNIVFDPNTNSKIVKSNYSYIILLAVIANIKSQKSLK